MSDPRISIISDVACELGEGPIFDPRIGALFWFDITGRKLLEKRWPDGETVVTELPVMASAIGLLDDDRQLLATETGLQIRDMRTGALRMHQPIEEEDASTRSNDARVHPCGAFWIGTMGKGSERGAGSIYWFFRGALRVLYPRVSIPNAICFSPDGATAYFVDSRENRLYRVACDPQTGLPTREPAVLVDRHGEPAAMDGAVVDAEGVIWNARWGAGSLDCYAPDGRLLRSYATPAKRTSCPAFAGPGADRVALTSAYQGMDEEARAGDPHAGKTFLLDIPVKGRLEPLAQP